MTYFYSLSFVVRLLIVLASIMATFKSYAMPIYYEGVVTSVTLEGDVLDLWNVDPESLTVGNSITGLLTINEDVLATAPRFSGLNSVSYFYPEAGGPPGGFIASTVADPTSSPFDYLGFGTGPVNSFDIRDSSIEPFRDDFAQSRFISLSASSDIQNFITSTDVKDLNFDLTQADNFKGEINYNFLNFGIRPNLDTIPRINDLNIEFDLSRLSTNPFPVAVSTPPIGSVFLMAGLGLLFVRKKRSK